MTISRAAGNAFLTASGPTPVATFVNGISAGGSLLVGWANSNLFSDTLSISDNINGAWHTAIAGNHSILLTSMLIAYFWNSQAGPAPACTLNGITGTNGSLTITEYLGAQSTSDPLNGTPSQQSVSAGPGNNPDSGAINTTTSGMITGFGTMFPNAPSSGFISPANMFVRATVSLTYPATIGDDLSEASGANNAIWDSANSETYWIAMACGFKVAGAASSGITAVGSSGGFGGGLKTPAVGSAARRRYFLPEYRV